MTIMYYYSGISIVNLYNTVYREGEDIASDNIEFYI